VTDDLHKPPEASLYDDDDPATADLAAKVAHAWTDFARSLADALPSLPVGSSLDLTLDPTASGVGDAVYGISLHPTDGGEMQAYAVGNSLLPPDHRLSRKAVADLVALGWLPAGVTADGDERLRLRLPTGQSARLAAIVSRTLRDVYGTPHPAFLVYTAQSGDDPVEVAPLGSARPAPATAGPAAKGAVPSDGDLVGLSLPEQVATVVAAMLKTTPDSLPIDKDGDIGIRSGSAMVFVRVRDEPPLVDVFSPVLTNVDASEKLYVKLSQLTHRMPIGRLYCTGETVWASVPVFGRDFQSSHLMLAVQVMTGLADELDDRLHGEFGGKRFFVESDRPGVDPPADQTGMYL
jgi:hypothetical protein